MSSFFHIITQCFPHLATGYEFDYVFDWTVLKYKQGQKPQHVPGAAITPENPEHLDKRTGVHPNESHEQMGQSHMTGLAAKLQGQNMAASAREAPPTSSITPPVVQGRNDGNSRHIVRFDAFRQNQGFFSNTGSSSACFPTFPHNAPAK